jgi:hypothetical protein
VESPPSDIEILRPHQLAWLRRPELSNAGLDIWEKPNGDLVSARAGVEPQLARRRSTGAVHRVG